MEIMIDNLTVGRIKSIKNRVKKHTYFVNCEERRGRFINRNEEIVGTVRYGYVKSENYWNCTIAYYSRNEKGEVRFYLQIKVNEKEDVHCLIKELSEKLINNFDKYYEIGDDEIFIDWNQNKSFDAEINEIFKGRCVIYNEEEC